MSMSQFASSADYWRAKFDAERAIKAELLEALRRTLAMLERCDCSTAYCCCGSAVESHGIGDGHSPVDEGDHYQSQAIESARAAIAKATGSVE